MAERIPGRPRFVSTFPSALLIALTFLVAGFALDWRAQGFAMAVEGLWPSQVVAFVVLLPAMMAILKYFGPRSS